MLVSAPEEEDADNPSLLSSKKEKEEEEAPVPVPGWIGVQETRRREATMINGVRMGEMYSGFLANGKIQIENGKLKMPLPCHPIYVDCFCLHQTKQQTSPLPFDGRGWVRGKGVVWRGEGKTYSIHSSRLFKYSVSG
jgi:hypothetical protein